MRKKKTITSFFVVAALFVFSPASGEAQTADHRLALVIGNSNYQKGPLATAANDAGLISQTLTTAGFDVTGAADLGQDAIRQAFRDFLGKVKAAGPHAVTFVYLAGYGLQYAGDNYFVPVDATLERDTDVPVEAIRIADFTRALAGMPIDARIFVLDAARANPFGTKGNPLAGGLALVDVEDGSLFAMNAAPGTIAPLEQGPYGTYAQALTEMLRYGGIPVDEAFDRARLRTNELSKGAFLPWDASRLTRPLVLLAGNPDAKDQPPLPRRQSLRSRPVRDYPTPAEAYAAAVEVDSLSAYQEFLSAYGSDPLAKRVRVLLAARREALTWDQTVRRNSPDAYWSYMRRYPRGPHYYDARRRLVTLSAPLEPPPRFDAYDFQGLAPPPEDEYEIVDRPVVIFDQRDYAPPPPPPAAFLPPPPKEYRRLPPPEARDDGYLPAIPVPIPLPFARPAQRQGQFNRPDFNAQPQQGGPGTPPGAPPLPGNAPQGAVPNGGAPAGAGPNGAGPNGAPVPQSGHPQGGPGQGQRQGQEPGQGRPNPQGQPQPGQAPQPPQGAQPNAASPGGPQPGQPAGQRPQGAPAQTPLPQTPPAAAPQAQPGVPPQGRPLPTPANPAAAPQNAPTAAPTAPREAPAAAPQRVAPPATPPADHAPAAKPQAEPAAPAPAAKPSQAPAAAPHGDVPRGEAPRGEAPHGDAPAARSAPQAEQPARPPAPAPHPGAPVPHEAPKEAPHAAPPAAARPEPVRPQAEPPHAPAPKPESPAPRPEPPHAPPAAAAPHPAAPAGAAIPHEPPRGEPHGEPHGGPKPPGKEERRPADAPQ